MSGIPPVTPDLWYINDADALGLPAHAFDRQDNGGDLDFYAPARLVTHIDDGAVSALSDFYRSIIPVGGHVLDLMSSWVSHLPEGVAYEVVGHGMNAEELAANPRLGRWFVQDLNREPTLIEPDASSREVSCRSTHRCSAALRNPASSTSITASACAVGTGLGPSPRRAAPNPCQNSR